MDDQSTTLENLRKLVVEFRDARNWKQFHNPKDLVLALGIEVAELGELLLWKDKEQVEQELSQKNFRERVEEELADVQILLLCFAAVTNIDISKSVEAKIAKNAQKYPIEKVYGKALKYTEYPKS